MPFLNDGSITYEMLVAKFNSDLVNTLGNLVNRTVAMVNKYFGGVIPAPAEKDEELDNDLINTVTEGYKKVTDCLESLHVADAADEIMTVLRRLNKYVDETAPWVLGKDEDKKDRLSTVLYNLVEGIRVCAILLKPFIPDAADTIITQIYSPENKTPLTIENWSDAEKFGYSYEAGSVVNSTPTPLFMRIDEKEFNARLEKDRLEAEKSDAKNKKAEEKPERAEEEVSEITIDDFAKVKLICAKVLECEKVEKSDKLLKLQLDDGSGKTRQVVSGIAKAYQPSELIGKKIVLVSNLKPVKLRGVDSFGMILAAGEGDKINVIFLDDAVNPGDSVR